MKKVLSFIIVTTLISTYLCAKQDPKLKTLSSKQKLSNRKTPVEAKNLCGKTPMPGTDVSKLIKNVYSLYNGRPRTPRPEEISYIKALLGINDNNKDFLELTKQCRPIGRDKHQLSLVFKNHNFEDYWTNGGQTGLRDLAYIKSFTPTSDYQVSNFVAKKYYIAWNQLKKNSDKFKSFVDQKISLTLQMKNPRDKYMSQRLIYSTLEKLNGQINRELPKEIYDFYRTKKYRIKIRKEISKYKKENWKPNK